jgi:hypothetical protein
MRKTSSISKLYRIESKAVEEAKQLVPLPDESLQERLRLQLEIQAELAALLKTYATLKQLLKPYISRAEKLHGQVKEMGDIDLVCQRILELVNSKITGETKGTADLIDE